MSFIIVVLCLALLIVLISYFKVDAFIAFLISSILAGIALGIPLEKLPDSVNNGIGSILVVDVDYRIRRYARQVGGRERSGTEDRFRDGVAFWY